MGKLQWCTIFLPKSLLHSSKFLVNAKFNLLTKYIFETTFNNDSSDILSVEKYCELFTHELNMFIFCLHTAKIHSNQWTRKPRKLPLPLEMWTPSNTLVSGPTPLHPNRQLDYFTHFSTTMPQSSHWLQWMPISTQKLPLCVGQLPTSTTYLILGPSRATTPNGIQIQSAVLPQPTGQTDPPTDR